MKVDEIRYWTPKQTTSGKYKIEIMKDGRVLPFDETFEIELSKIEKYLGIEITQKIILGEGITKNANTAMKHKAIINLDINIKM